MIVPIVDRSEVVRKLRHFESLGWRQAHLRLSGPVQVARFHDFLELYLMLRGAKEWFWENEYGRTARQDFATAFTHGFGDLLRWPILYGTILREVAAYSQPATLDHRPGEQILFLRT